MVRVNKNNELINSKPCIVCCKLIKRFGIKKIFYSDSNGNIVAKKSSELDDSHISFGTRVLLEHDPVLMNKKLSYIEMIICRSKTKNHQ